LHLGAGGRAAEVDGVGVVVDGAGRVGERLAHVVREGGLGVAGRGEDGGHRGVLCHRGGGLGFLQQQDADGATLGRGLLHVVTDLVLGRVERGGHDGSYPTTGLRWKTTWRSAALPRVQRRMPSRPGSSSSWHCERNRTVLTRRLDGTDR